MVDTPLKDYGLFKKSYKKFQDTLNNPAAHNVGRLDPNAKNVGTGMVGAPACRQ